MITALLYGFALVCGALSPVHSGFNTTLSHHLGPVRAAFISSILASVMLVLALLAVGQLRLPAGRSAVPWWAWASGVIEAVVVLSQPVVAPKVGAAAYTALLVTASVVVSVALDHLGLLGFAQRTATFGRLAGAAFMIGGMVMVATL